MLLQEEVVKAKELYLPTVAQPTHWIVVCFCVLVQCVGMYNCLFICGAASIIALFALEGFLLL